MRVAIALYNKPAIGWNDVLVTHVIPRASSFLTFIMILRTCSHVEMGAKRQIAFDGCSFGNPSCHARECREGLNTIRLFPVMPSVFHRRARKRVTVTTRETTFKQFLVVNHHLVGISARVVAPKTALCMLAPKTNATFGSCRNTAPCTIHRNNPYASINAIGCSHCRFGLCH